MEEIHIKLEAGEAINAKKNLLSTEINILNLIKKIRDYKRARKEELKKKAKLRTELRKLINEMKILEKELPETKGVKKTREGRVKVKLIGKAKSTKLESELEDIKRKLERLG